MDCIKIGNYISTLRKEKKYTQKELAYMLDVSEKTVSKWECGRGLPEVIYMEPLCKILGITVNELLAGQTIPLLDLIQTLDKTRIELVRQLEFEQLKMRLYKIYDIEIDSMNNFHNGAGGLTYLVTSKGIKYVVKYPSDNEMNHPELESQICKELIKKGLPVCDFVMNKQGKELSMDEIGRRFNVQKYYDGCVYKYNEAPKECQIESAQMLGKIHKAMKNINELPIGIGKDFFYNRRPENMELCYEKTLQKAMDSGEKLICDKICSNMQIARTFPDYIFDVKRFSVGNTHGDYNISQIIWKENQISGVIDWTCACRHPYIWEVMRSYLFMAPECKNGDVDIGSMIDYLRAYMEFNTLNTYDIINAGKLMYYFFVVCDFYGQYLTSITPNKSIYLEQANLTSGLLKWFKINIDELNNRLSAFANEIENQKKMTNYYNIDGKLIQYPSKKALRELALGKIATYFESEKKYTEKEVNIIISNHIAFNDIELIRRELIEMRILGRLRDGSEYWLEENK